MRVIAGTYRSRILKSLKGLALRPTSDRLRETLFNVLAAGIIDSRFIDVFAGTGAVGIEAISRGAAEVVFIENHAPAAALIRKNLASLDVRSGAQVICADAMRALESLQTRIPGAGYHYVFIDPPYAAESDYSRVLQFLAGSDIVADGGIVIVEHRYNYKLPEEIKSLRRVRVLRQGDAGLSFFRSIMAAKNELISAGNP